MITFSTNDEYFVIVVREFSLTLCPSMNQSMSPVGKSMAVALHITDIVRPTSTKFELVVMYMSAKSENKEKMTTSTSFRCF